MSTIKAFLLGGALGAAAGAVLGGVVGGKLGRYLGERESRKAMSYMGITEVTDDVINIQKSFEMYADDFGKRLGEQLGTEVGEQFAENLKQKCFLNDKAGNVVSTDRMVGQRAFAQVPLLRQTDLSDPSEWYVGPESERSSLFEYFDRYYEAKGGEKGQMDKHVMIVRFLDNMTYMVLNYLQILEQCPGDQFEKAIAVLESEYGLLMHNFLASQAQVRDSSVLALVRGAFAEVNVKILELKKEKLGYRLEEGYTKRFEEAKANQKNLTVMDTAYKIKETLNQEATATHEFLLRGLGKVKRPEEERMVLAQLAGGVARGNLDKPDMFNDSILGKVVQSYAKNLYELFPRIDQQNQRGKIQRFDEHFQAGRIDANVAVRVDRIILETHRSIPASERNLYLEVATYFKWLEYSLCLAIGFIAGYGQIRIGWPVSNGRVGIQASKSIALL